MKMFRDLINAWRDRTKARKEAYLNAAHILELLAADKVTCACQHTVLRQAANVFATYGNS